MDQSKIGGEDSCPPSRPAFRIGSHRSDRNVPLSDMQYGIHLNQAPITNRHFKDRVMKLLFEHQCGVMVDGTKSLSHTSSLVNPAVPSLTPDDTGLFPSAAVSTYIACTSSWIDLCSEDPFLANLSRQVLNLEVNYASFCGVKSIMITGPRKKVMNERGSIGLARYARAVQEALRIGKSLLFSIKMPMSSDEGLFSTSEPSMLQSQHAGQREEGFCDPFRYWSAWDYIRAVCGHNLRLLVALHLPEEMPEKDLCHRWFAEPLQYLLLNKSTFDHSKDGLPRLSSPHQDFIFRCMQSKLAPGLMLCDFGPRDPYFASESMSTDDVSNVSRSQGIAGNGETPKSEELAPPSGKADDVINYLQCLETQQPVLSKLNSPSLIGFQDWLQSPLQPLSDNLESATYEVFEGDAIKYDQYEAAICEALRDWKKLELPTSKKGAVVLAVAGSGRGPLVTRALRAAEQSGVPVEVWAIEKNPNAYVYLLQQNRTVWGGCVYVVKTDMRAWKGPKVTRSTSSDPEFDKVDILISELLGSFGDNELSPECLDGIQHVLAKPHGIAIPSSYTSHLSPISTPKIYADLLARSAADHMVFDIPWVVNMFAFDFVSQRVPNHPRIQQAWEFRHPVPDFILQAAEAKRSGGVAGGGGGSMAGAAGANDHNTRHCHLTFVCRTAGVVHGLAGYFESVLYQSRTEENAGPTIEISIHPERIEEKNKDMLSWFPFFFALRKPIVFPADTELEVNFWRQTNDAQVWYEWLVEAWTWINPSTRVKVATSELGCSRGVACQM